MADSAIPITAGAGTAVDTRTNAGGEHRQVVVLGGDGDPVCSVVDPAAIPNALNAPPFLGPALNVNTNAIAKATYIGTAGATGISTGALTANTRKDVLSLHHAGTAVRTVRIRRIFVGGFQTGTAAVGTVYGAIFRGTAAPTGGTAIAAAPTHPASPAAEVVVTTLPAITAATLVHSNTVGLLNAATALTGFPATVFYEWRPGSVQSPLTLRAATLDALVLAIYSNAPHTLTLQISVIFTEE